MDKINLYFHRTDGGAEYLTDTYIFETNSNIISAVDRVSSKIMSPGIPENWTNEYVVSVGLTTENCLNTTKIEYLENLTIENYPNVKAMFGIKSDFLIFFKNRNFQCR